MRTNKTRVPGIQNATSDNLVQVANALKEVVEVREGIRGDPMDKAVTFRDLEELKLVQETAAASSVITGLPVQVLPSVNPAAFKPDNYDETADLSTPPAPTNLIATGGYSAIYLSWQYPAYKNHAYTEVWRSYVNDLNTASLIGTTPGNLFSDPVGTEITAYYWVRIVSMANVTSQYNSYGGTMAATAIDVARRLDGLETNIQNSSLYLSLQSQIDELSTANTSFVSQLSQVNAQQATLINNIISVDGSNKAAIQIQAQAVNGLGAQYTVKIDNNGHVAGFGLASEVVNGTPTSAFIVRADKFAIVSDTDTSNPLGTTTPSTGTVPFVVLTTPTTIDGLTYPAGTYMRSAFIADATITSAKIQNLAADKITAGTISAAVTMTSPTIKSGAISYGQSGFFLGLDGGANKFYVGNGTTGTSGRELSFNGTDVTVRGTLYAYQGQIGGITITQSSIYSGMSTLGFGTGFHLNSSGLFGVGNPSGNYMSWNGSTLAVTGTITAVAGQIGGNTISASSVYSPNFSSGSAGWRLLANGDAEFNNVTVRGTVRTGSIYIASGGMQFVDTTTSIQVNSTVAIAERGTNTGQLASAADYMYPLTNIRLYSPNYSGAPLAQRLRWGSGVRATVSVTCTTDSWISVWVRSYTTTGGYSAWTHLAGGADSQADYGAAAVGAAVTLDVSANGFYEFGISSYDEFGWIYNSAKSDIKDFSVVVTAVNF